MDIIRIRGIFLFVVAFLNLVLALLLWSKSKNDKTKLWLGVTALFSGLYAFLCGGTYFFWQEDSIVSVYWQKSTWLGTFILPPFNIFAYYFTQNTKNIKLKSFFLFSGASLISFLSLFTTNLIENKAYLVGYNISAKAGILDPLGRIYILIGLIVAIANLLNGYFRSENLRKTQLRYFVLGTTIFTSVGIITTSVVPLFTGVSSHYDIAAYFSFFWVVLTVYAVFRYNLFNIRVFAKELLTFGIWTLLFIRIILSNNYQDFLLNLILATLLTILGILFLKSVYKENELNKKLLEESKKNFDIEQRLRKTYAEIAGEKIKRIEKVVFDTKDENL